ncbi:MAG TPA: hypothetical protein PKD09_10580 [Aggregatilinea sp.]|uniref:hypothetical protein n=1 Tax=Aggregatilinea sp. TaxID=2806333 RepID=UPI002BB008FB|nr:hypothetical protein [Aggregatilinea sp.]HML22088.1 hypothetical protein [Aggregatilinea sp.]
MADQVETAILAVEPDEASFRKSRAQLELLDARVKLAASRLDDIRRAGQNAKDGFQVTESGATRAYKALYDVRKAELDYAAAVERSAQSQGKAIQAESKRRREVEQTADATRQAREEDERRYDAQVRAAAQNVETYGDLASRGTALAGLASGVGAGGVSQGLYLGADVLDSVEAIGRAPAELSKVAAEIGVSTAALGAFGAGTVALSAGIYAVIQSHKDYEAELEAFQARLKLQLDAEDERARIISQSTSEQLQGAIDQAQAEKSLADERSAYYRALKGDQQTMRDAADELSGIWDLLSPGEQKQKLEEFNQTYGEQLQALSDIAAENDQIFDAQVQNYDNLTESWTLAGKAIETYSEQQTKWIESARDAAATARDFTEALDSNTVAQNDRIATMKADAEGARRAAEEIAQARLEQFTREETWTSEQVRSRLEAIDRERRALEAQKESLETSAEYMIDTSDAMEALGDEFEALRLEEYRLTAQILPAAEARERETKAAEDFKNRLEDIQKAMETATDRAATYLQSMHDLTASYEKDTARTTAQRDLADQRDQADAVRAALKAQRDFVAAEIKAERSGLAERQKIIDGLAADLAAEEAEGAEDRRKALADFRDEDTKATKEHNKRLLEISREANKSLRDALRSRDVDAAWAALERGQEQITAENETNAEQRQQRQEELDKQLADLTASLDKEADKKRAAAQEALTALTAQLAEEKATRLQAYQDQRTADEESRRLRLDRLAEDRAIEDAAREQAYQDQQQQLWNNLTGQDNIYKTGFDRIKTTVESKFKEAIENPIIKGLASILTGSATSSTSISNTAKATTGSYTANYGVRQGWNRFNFNIGSFADGGDVLPYSDILVGERGPEWLRLFNPATVYSHGQTPPMGGDTYLTLNAPITGVESPQDVVEAFENQVLPRLTSALQQFSSGQHARGYRYG